MRRDAEFFGGAEVELVHISRKLREALAVEDELTQAGVDYLVEADNYQARFLMLFPTDRVGAFFWVAADEASRVRDVLGSLGFTVTAPDGPDLRRKEAIP